MDHPRPHVAPGPVRAEGVLALGGWLTALTSVQNGLARYDVREHGQEHDDASSTMPTTASRWRMKRRHGRATGRMMLDGDDLDRLGLSLRCQAGSSGRPSRT